MPVYPPTFNFSPLTYEEISTLPFCGGNEYYDLDPLNCIIQPGLDGKLNSCYDIPIPLPMCITSNYTDISTPILFSNHTSYSRLDNLYIYPLSVSLILYAAGLGLTVMTFLNIIVLTPNHKRRLPLHNILLLGLLSLIIQVSCRLFLFANTLSSSYLWLTNDFASQSWSTTTRAAEFSADLTEILALLALQILFFIQARALLSWVKLFYRRWIYHTILYLFAFLGLLAWLCRCTSAVMRIRKFAFVRDGDWPVPNAYTYNQTYSVGAILFGMSIVLWSLCNSVTVVRILWERKKTLFSSRMMIDGDDSMTPLKPGQGRVVNAYEKALWIIGIVTAQSFIAPMILCIFSLASDAILMPIIMPVVYGLMPMSSLFVENKVKQDANHQKIKTREEPEEFLMTRNVKQSAGFDVGGSKGHFAELPGDS